MILSTQMISRGGCLSEIRKIIRMTKTAMVSLTKIQKSHSIMRKTKISLVQSLVFPIASYAVIWTLKKRKKDMLNVFEMWC